MTSASITIWCPRPHGTHLPPRWWIRTLSAEVWKWGLGLLALVLVNLALFVLYRASFLMALEMARRSVRG